MTPEQRAQLANLTPEQRQALEQQAALDNLAEQVAGAVQAVQRGEIPARALWEQLVPLAQRVAHDEELGLGRHELVGFLQAVVGSLEGEPGGRVWCRGGMGRCGRD